MITMCRICETIKRTKYKLYESERVVAFLSEQGVKGTCLVAPKKHYTIIEETDDVVLKECFVIANKISGLMFDALNCTGTNIIINNGDGANQEFSHFLIYVIPRFENDDLSLTWKRTKVNIDDLRRTEEELQSILLSNEDAHETSEASFEDLEKNTEKKEPPYKEINENPEQEETSSQEQDENTETQIQKNTLLRNLKRIP